VLLKTSSRQKNRNSHYVGGIAARMLVQLIDAEDKKTRYVDSLCSVPGTTTNTLA